jgi:hypothetical protein
LLPLGPVLPLLAIPHIRTEEYIKRGVIVNPQGGTPSNSPSSSSNSLTPPSPPIQDIEDLEEMAQLQRLLNIAPFPYFYGRPGMILMHMWIDF